MEPCMLWFLRRDSTMAVLLEPPGGVSAKTVLTIPDTEALHAQFVGASDFRGVLICN